MPGPGTYNAETSYSTDGYKYSMRPRTSSASTSILKKITFSILGFLGKAANGKQESPGPGQYENREVINQRGSYFLAKYKNSGAPAFNPPNSKRFKHYNNNSVSQPGPGHYTPKTDLPSTGEYFVSKYQGSMCRTFYHSDRTTLKIPKQSQGKQCL